MSMEKQSKQAHNYFNDWAEDYELAFEEGGREKSPFHRLINLLFRRKTFHLRTQHLSEILSTIDVNGKEVLDIGCGTGQLALQIALNGGLVTGLDISEEMINICNAKAHIAGVEDRVQFHVCDCIQEELPQADIVLCIAVIEYYKNSGPFLRKLCRSARSTLILCDSRYIWWRAWLRKILAITKGFSVFYHEPAKVKAIVQESGMECVEETELHSFMTFLFQRDTSGN